MKKIIIISILSFFLFSFSANAQEWQEGISGTDQEEVGTWQEGISGDPSVSDKPIRLVNPLGGKNNKGVNSIPELIEKILEIVLTLGVPLVAIMIIYSGYLFVQARGNAAELEKAKDTLTYTIIGAAILLGAYVIAEAIVGTVCAIKGGSC